MKYAGRTFSGPKTTIIADQITIIGFEYTSWRAVGYYMYQHNETEPKKIHYIKFNYDGEDLKVIKENPDDEDPLPLEAFIDEIDNRTGFFQSVLKDIPEFQLELDTVTQLFELEQQERHRISECADIPRTVKQFLEDVEELETSMHSHQSEEEDVQYDGGRRSSDILEQEKCLEKIREWLTTSPKPTSYEKLDPERAKFLRAASHFWIDDDGKMYNYVMHGRCGLSSCMEACVLRKENARTIGEWLFEDIMCRWGSLIKIVTDNGGPFKKAVAWLEEKYGIKGVAISPYNSQANGGDVKKWFWHLHHVMWAEGIMVRKGTGCSPYFLVTGTHPMIPLDVIEATWLVKYPDRFISTTELVGLRAQALAKHAAHVEEMHACISAEKVQWTMHLEEEMKHKIISNEVKPGDLVLVKNSSIEKSADRKMKPRYLGPMVVIQWYRGGAFLLAEPDGSIWINKVAAFRIVPYLVHAQIKFSARVQEALDAMPEWLEKQCDEDEQSPGDSIEDLEEIHTAEASKDSD
ncbi:hypothetical protein AN958_03428 [Leucoagaricus sp. SymC.cos]|nr:hypothetical protein AN958_03428 [Leucoagaricus sp. SymC.cos]